ncbi:MAG: hypothetical protein ACK4VZ_14835 [Paracoccaceae bacterium]
MPNEPQHAKEKRTPPAERQNAQDDHEGSAHAPEEFDVMNPQKQGLGDNRPDRGTPETSVKR